MYCKNCGKKLEGNVNACPACSIPVGYGNQFCPHCGAQVQRGQAVCLKCGFAVQAPVAVPTRTAAPAPQPTKTTSASAATQTKEDYKKYIPAVKRSNLFALIGQLAALLVVICVVFLPIYKAETKITEDDLLASDFKEKLEQWNDLDKLLADKDFWLEGKVDIGFSLYDDVQRIAEAFFSGVDEATDEAAMLGGLFVFMNLFAVFEVIFAVIIVILTIKQICKVCSEALYSHETALLKYDEIKKTSIAGVNSNKKNNLFKQQSVVSIVLYAVFDILFLRIFGGMFDMMPMPDDLLSTRYMSDFNGVTQYIFAPVVLLAIYLIFQGLSKAEEKSIRVSIVKKQYGE